MNIDRSQAPPLGFINELPLTEPTLYTATNGTRINVFDLGDQEYIQLQLVYEAGRIHAPKVLIAELCAEMILSGTSFRNAATIAELLDFYGASVEPSAGDDDATITLFCLGKHLEKVLPLLAELVQYSIFPEEEAAILLSKWKQRLQISLKKNDQLANRIFRQTLFSQEHPYGRITMQADFDQVNMDDVRSFFAERFVKKSPHIIIAGKLPEKINEWMEKSFGVNATLSDPLFSYPDKAIPVLKTKTVKEEKADSVQSSIRMGKIMFGMSHPDYFDMYVLNAILGGYFGSRLMDNIREEKGYTYGIHSGILSRAMGGYLEISTEVNREVCDLTINEIKKELRRLQKEEVDAEELETVKNYILGQMLRSMDGPFQLGKLYRRLMIYGHDLEFSRKFAKSIREVSSGRLKELAIKYLDPESMTTVIVG